MNAKDFAIGVMVDTLGFTTEEASALFDADGNAIEGATDTAKAKRASQVEADKATRKKVAEEQKNAGMRQKGEWYEKQLKALGIELGDATGEDAIEKIKAHLETLGTQGKVVDPKDEQAIRNSKVFRDEQLAMAKKHADLVKDYETKLTEKETGYQRRDTLRAVRDDAMATLTELNAVLPDDPKVKANQLRLLDLYMQEHTFEKEGDTYVVKDKDGNALTNAQGYPVKYKDFLKQGITDNFPIAASKEKTTAGNPLQGTKGSGVGTGLKKPANKEDAAAMRHKINSDTTLDYEGRKKLHAELDALEAVAS